jgi:hypothetical protein
MAKWQQAPLVEQGIAQSKPTWADAPLVEDSQPSDVTLSAIEEPVRQFSSDEISRINMWQKHLQGKLPTEEPLKAPQSVSPLERFHGPFAKPDEPRQSIERRRRRAFDELQGMGFSREEIAGALAFEEGIKPPSRAPQIVGATAATLLAGRIIPGPVDDAAIATRLLQAGGKATAAGIGGAAGKAVQMVADPDIDFNTKEVARVFGEEAGLELATLGLAPIGRRILRPIKQTGIEGAEKLSKKLAQRGKQLAIKTPTRFLPAQFSENQLIDTIQGIGEGSLIGSNVLFQYKKGQFKAAASLVDDLAETISKGAAGRSSDDVAALLVDAVEGGKRAKKVVGMQLYNAVDEVAGRKMVDMRPTKQLALQLQEQIQRAGGVGQTAGTSRTLGISSAEDFLSFAEARASRSDLLDIIRMGESKLSPDPKAVSLAKRLMLSVDSAVMTTAKEAGPEVESMLRRANWFHKASKDRFANKTIRTLIKQLSDPALAKPEVANVIFKSRHNIMRVQKAVGKASFQKAKGAWIQNIIRDSMVPDPSDIKGIGQPIGTRILKKFNGVGQPALDAAFTVSEQKVIRENARIMAILQAKTGGQAGALRFVQGAALAGVAVGPLTGEQVGRQATKGGAVLLAGPAVLGRLMASPTFGKLLSEGYKAPPGTQQSVALTARLVRNIMQARREVNLQRAKIQLQERDQRLGHKPLTLPELSRFRP